VKLGDEPRLDPQTTLEDNIISRSREKKEKCAPGKTIPLRGGKSVRKVRFSEKELRKKDALSPARFGTVGQKGGGKREPGRSPRIAIELTPFHREGLA